MALEDELTDILEESAARSDGPSPDLLAEVWETLVGRELAGVTRPESLEDGVLTITAGSEEWKAELVERKLPLLRRIDDRLPWPVDELELDAGDLPQASRSPPRSGGETETTDPTDVEVDAQTEEALAGVDPEIGETLKRIRQHLIDERDD